MLLQGIEILAFLSSEWAVTIRLQSKGPDLIDYCSSSTLVQRLISALTALLLLTCLLDLAAAASATLIRSILLLRCLQRPPPVQETDGNYELVTDGKYKWLQNILNTSDYKIFQGEYAPLHKQFNGSLCLDLLLYHSTYSTIFMNSHLHK